MFSHLLLPSLLALKSRNSSLYRQLICCSDMLSFSTPHTQLFTLSWAPEVAASPAKVLLFIRVRVGFLSTGARGTAHSFVVRVDTQSSLNHHHAVVVLVTATRVCQGKGEISQLSMKKGEEKQNLNKISLFYEMMDLLISARHGSLLHSSRLLGFKLGSQSLLGMMPSVRQRTSRTR